MYDIPLQIMVIGVTMVALDAVWLTMNAAASRSVIAAIQTKPMEIRWIPAAFVYILMIAATWFFAVWKTPSWKVATAKGAALGLARQPAGARTADQHGAGVPARGRGALQRAPIAAPGAALVRGPAETRGQADPAISAHVSAEPGN